MAIDAQEYRERYGRSAPSSGRGGGLGVTIKKDSAFAALDRLAKGMKESGVYICAQAGAQVFYMEAKLTAPIGETEHYFYGTQFKVSGKKYGPFYPGNLRDAIYQAQRESRSGGGHATYVVSWNKTKAPYGHMVEYGTARAAGTGFMRRAYEQAKPDAMVEARAALDDYLVKLKDQK